VAGMRNLAERYSATDTGEVALLAWDWSLSSDSEAARHWRPRARGVCFRGNTAEGPSRAPFRFPYRAATLPAVGGSEGLGGWTLRNSSQIRT
jgi:hypothetical protein